jgi:hypothetical protein
MTVSQPQDIEIYLAATPAADALAWLAGRFPEHDKPRPAGKRQWQQHVRHGEVSIPVLVIEEASPGFTSVWFNSPTTPWASDADCAREAFAHFGREVRATAGTWKEDADPDEWWSIGPTGERFVQWPG